MFLRNQVGFLFFLFFKILSAIATSLANEDKAAFVYFSLKGRWTITCHSLIWLKPKTKVYWFHHQYSLLLSYLQVIPLHVNKIWGPNSRNAYFVLAAPFQWFIPTPQAKWWIFQCFHSPKAKGWHEHIILLKKSRLPNWNLQIDNLITALYSLQTLFSPLFLYHFYRDNAN